MDNRYILAAVEKSLRGGTIDDLIIGWKFNIEEVSSNVYKVDGVDLKGHRVSSYGIDPEKALTKCIKDAQRIEQRIKLIAKIKSDIGKIFMLLNK